MIQFPGVVVQTLKPFEHLMTTFTAANGNIRTFHATL